MKKIVNLKVIANQLDHILSILPCHPFIDKTLMHCVNATNSGQIIYDRGTFDRFNRPDYLNFDPLSHGMYEPITETK